MAIFFGTGFRNVPDLDWNGYIGRVNECLQYMRERCGDCDLYYKPHPAETDETSLLNLEGFQIIREKNIADTYLQDHHDHIKYVFSVHSIVSATAYSLGLNAYMFMDVFHGIYNETLLRWYREVYFSEMPESFFIRDLSASLHENKKALPDDRELEGQVRRMLAQRAGTVWFILTVSPLDVLLSVVTMVRRLEPNRRIGLLLYRHRRWDAMNLDDIRSRFDEVHVFPRAFYSLHPRRLLQMLRVARAVRRFPIAPDDIFFGFSGYEFLENCFISYHPRVLRVAFWTYRSFLCHQNSGNNSFFRGRQYRFTWASRVYFRILFPLLGLRRVLYLQPAGKDRLLFAMQRYERPMNEEYDYVMYLHA
ncbi:MAG: hypothetical protein IT406_04055 [Candidatus Yanofskybacteria bacterium]|nr:hypothetical protein [Candidatus Yanofskybacteria bacterium]